MSLETMEWLNTYTLVGFTEKRGKAWHYRTEGQDEESNHYSGPVPVEDVTRRLFNFKVIEAPIYYQLPDGEFIPSQQSRKGMLRSDNHFDLGAFKEGYQGHDYEEWLIDNWSHILDTSKNELGIGSAGLLKKGAQAWVSIERPESITTPEGVEFRPFLLGYTSFDGSLATGYGGKITNVVCDNTLQAATSEKGQSIRMRHTRHSMLRINEAREALGIIFNLEETFANEVAELTKWKVSDKQLDKFLDIAIPIPEIPDGKEKNRGTTVAEKKREEILALYRNDDRAAPWNGTAFGVLAAFNTWNHHFAQVRGDVPRVIRNMENVVSDKFGKADRELLEQLTSVK